MRNIVFIAGLFFVLIMVSRGCNCSTDGDFKKSPVDELVKNMKDISTFSIILYDMDTEGSFVKTYKHQYQIVKQKDSIPTEEITDWYEVDETFFESHIDDMGMEIVSKTNGKLKKEVSPPGYSNYIGNPQYGHWVTGSNGSSFWEFFGQYMFMSSMFNLLTMPAYRSYYDDYRGNYYGQGRPFYGNNSSGQKIYGTDGSYASQSQNNKQWFSKSSNSSFRDKVRNRVSRSTGSGSKVTRSSSRFGTSSRSRSRGFGK